MDKPKAKRKKKIHARFEGNKCAFVYLYIHTPDITHACTVYAYDVRQTNCIVCVIVRSASARWVMLGNCAQHKTQCECPYVISVEDYKSCGAQKHNHKPHTTHHDLNCLFYGLKQTAAWLAQIYPDTISIKSGAHHLFFVKQTILPKLNGMIENWINLAKTGADW